MKHLWLPALVTLTQEILRFFFRMKKKKTYKKKGVNTNEHAKKINKQRELFKDLQSDIEQDERR